MVNDRKDKYEGNQPEEEGEYHFSEDEISYEVESETQKKTSSAASLKDNLLNRLSGSKRMLISLAALLILVFVIYKFISPSTPSLNITPEVPAQTTSATNSMAQPTPTSQPVLPSNQVVATPQQPQAVTPMQPPATPTATTTQPQTTGMPVVIPVQAPSPAYPNKEIASEPASGAELVWRRWSANNEKLITQFQTEYTQKLNDFAAQNKALQDQLQFSEYKSGSHGNANEPTHSNVNSTK